MPNSVRRKLSSEQGSATIIAAVVISTLMALGSMSQSITTMLSSKEISKTLSGKVGKRANGGSLELSDTLVKGRTITYVAWTDKVVWTVAPGAGMNTFWKFQTQGPDDLLITVDACNPKHYSGTTQTNIFANKISPILTRCQSEDDMEHSVRHTINTTLDLMRPSNGGVWVVGGNNFIPANGLSKVAQGEVGPPKAPVNDDARINLGPNDAPKPACTLRIISPADKRIVTGQTVTYEVVSSLNAHTVPGGNYPGTPVSFLPTDAGNMPLLNDGVAQQGVITLRLSNPNAANYAFPVTATMNGPGGTATCTDTATVYPVPRCTLRASPPEITVGQQTSLILTTSNNSQPSVTQSPITQARIDGTPVGINGGTKVVTPPQGTPTYYAQVWGINNYPVQSCAVAVPTYAYPVCSVRAVPPAIYTGQAATVVLSTNYSARGNTSGNNNSGTQVLDEVGRVHNLPVTGGAFTYQSYWPPLAGWHVFYGRVSAVNGAAAGQNLCAATLQVVPPPYCRFLIPGYWEHIPTPFGYMSYLGMGVYNPEGSPFVGDPAGGGTFVNGDFVYCNANQRCSMGHTLGVAAGFNNIYYIRYNNVADQNCPMDIEWRAHGCFTPETRVRAGDGAWLRADAVRKGMTLWNPKKKREMVVTKVVRGPEKLPMIEVGYDDYRVHVTTEHAVPTAHGIKQAQALTMEDQVLGADAKYHALKVLRRLPVKKDQFVWNFETAGDQNDPFDFVVDSEGVVTGNLTLQKQLLKQADRRLP